MFDILYLPRDNMRLEHHRIIIIHTLIENVFEYRLVYRFPLVDGQNI